jgi:hypothetical protein
VIRVLPFPAGYWTDEQNEAIVADFAMLADDIAGRPYSKAEHNRPSDSISKRRRRRHKSSPRRCRFLQQTLARFRRSAVWSPQLFEDQHIRQTDTTSSQIMSILTGALHQGQIAR